jgi:CDP-glycerol glycerophosphotransferase
MINGEIITDIKLRQDEIDTWKAQFLKEYPKVEMKTHEDLWWIKVIRFPKRVRRVFRKFAKKVKTILSKIKVKLAKFKKKLTQKNFDSYIRNKYSKTMAANPVEKGKVMFFTFQGDYTCNPKYISEEIFRRNLPWQQVWVTLKNPEMVKEFFPDNVKIVQFNTEEYYDELSKSQIWIDNAFNFVKGFLPKKEGQTYVETMHGSLGLKKIGPDVVDDAKRNERGFLCGSLTDLCLSNSSFETMVYETSFWKKENIIEVGHARNDIFFIDDKKVSEIKRRVCEYFSLDMNVHMALYAPTFRNDKEAVEFEKIDFEKLHDALTKRFGGTWYILNRAHHSSLKKSKISKLKFVKNANEYPDIQELMIAIDMGITDYSSWICDYVLTYKPGLLYTPDLDSYDYNRGFYYPIQETPFPIGKTNDELVEKILNFDEEAFRKDTDRFLEARGCIDDGHASERIVELLAEIVNK